jgi:hypothetical protein
MISNFVHHFKKNHVFQKHCSWVWKMFTAFIYLFMNSFLLHHFENCFMNFCRMFNIFQKIVHGLQKSSCFLKIVHEYRKLFMIFSFVRFFEIMYMLFEKLHGHSKNLFIFWFSSKFRISKMIWFEPTWKKKVSKFD